MTYFQVPEPCRAKCSMLTLMLTLGSRLLCSGVQPTPVAAEKSDCGCVRLVILNSLIYWKKWQTTKFFLFFLTEINIAKSTPEILMTVSNLKKTVLPITNQHTQTWRPSTSMMIGGDSDTVSAKILYRGPSNKDTSIQNTRSNADNVDCCCTMFSRQGVWTSSSHINKCRGNNTWMTGSQYITLSLSCQWRGQRSLVLIFQFHFTFCIGTFWQAFIFLMCA